MILKDLKTKLVRASVIPHKWQQWYRVKVLTGIVESLRSKRLIFKGDQEPATQALKDAVNSEARIEIIMGESPEYESKSNGEVEQPRWRKGKSEQ